MADRTLNVKISGDTSSLSRALGKASRESQTFGQRARGHVAGGMMAIGRASLYAGGAIGVGIVAGLVESVKQAEEAQRVQAQTNAVLRSTGHAANVSGKQVSGMADSLSMLSGVDDEAIQSGENLMLTFRNVRNEAGKGNDIFNQATKATLDMSVAMGEDLHSATIQVGKALNDPIHGMSALQRVGVTFSDKQKTVIQRLQETGHTAQAQKLILGELNKEFGGSAKAAGDTFEGSMNKAKVALGNLGETIGAAVMPALAGALTQFAKWVQALSKSRTAHEVVQRVLHALADAFNFVRHVVGAVAGFIRDHWTQIKRAVSTAANFISTQVLPRLRAALNFVKQVVGNLAQGFQQAWPDIKKALSQAWEAMKPVLKLLGHLLSEVIAPAILWLSKHSGTAFSTLALAIQGIAYVVGAVLRPLAAAIQHIIDGMKWIIENVPSIPSSIGGVHIPGLSGGLLNNVATVGGGGAAGGGGHVYLDGKLVGQWLRDSQRSYGRANSGKLIITP